MVDNYKIYELVFAIILNIAYFAFFLIKLRKEERFASGILWGILAFFISYASTTAMVLVFGNLVASVGLAKFSAIQILINSLSQILGIVFSSAFIFRLMDQRKIMAKKSASIVGFMSGSGILASPINMNSQLLVLTQLITNALFLNTGGEQLDKLPIEQIEEVKLFYESSPTFGFIAFTMYGLALAFGFWVIYQIVGAYRTQKEPRQRFGIPFIFGFIYFLMIESIPVLIVSPIFKIIALLSLGYLTYKNMKKLIYV